MKILLVEDDRMHSAYLKDIVERALPEVNEILVAADGKAGETLARQHEIQAIIMDLRMQGGNGIEAARNIWSDDAAARILFWSNYSDEAYLRGIVRIVPPEASYGYVLKTASPERLQLAMRAVLIEGQIVVDRKVHQIQNSQTRSNDMLTEVEYTLIIDLSLGLTDKMIAQRRKLSLRTVQNRLLSLYEKLNIDVFEVEGCKIQLNKRVKAVSSAIVRNIINNEIIEIAEKDLRHWLDRVPARQGQKKS